MGVTFRDVQVMSESTDIFRNIPPPCKLVDMKTWGAAVSLSANL